MKEKDQAASSLTSSTGGKPSNKGAGRRAPRARRRKGSVGGALIQALTLAARADHDAQQAKSAYKHARKEAQAAKNRFKDARKDAKKARKAALKLKKKDKRVKS